MDTLYRWCLLTQSASLSQSDSTCPNQGTINPSSHIAAPWWWYTHHFYNFGVQNFFCCCSAWACGHVFKYVFRGEIESQGPPNGFQRLSCSGVPLIVPYNNTIYYISHKSLCSAVCMLRCCFRGAKMKEQFWLNIKIILFKDIWIVSLLQMKLRESYGGY